MKKSRFVLLSLIAIATHAFSINSHAADLQTNTPVDPEGLFKVPGFHQVMVSTGTKTVYVAGQVAYNADMTLVGAGDYKAQTIKALNNLKLAVNAAGATTDDIVSSTLNIKGLNGKVAQEVMSAMATALDGKPFPAHAFNMIGVEALADPRVLIEISAIAVTH